MEDSKLIEILADEARLYSLAQSAFPEAGLSPENFHNILTDAKQSSLPLIRHLGEREPLDEETRANLTLQQSCEGHTTYKLLAEHVRVAPFSSGFVEECQAVRVKLTESLAEAKPIWTRLGVVKKEDHLIFSVQEVIEKYQDAFSGAAPTVGRVDLVTGARDLDLARFSPISIFFAYEKAEDQVPSFYFLESGSVTGRPEVLYFAKDLEQTIVAQAGFAFTPFACAKNWYNGVLQMQPDRKEPQSVSISVAQEQQGKRHYLTVNVSYEVATPDTVIFPGAQMIVAVMRVFAIGLGLQFDRGAIGRALGEWCRRHTDWQIVPPKSGEPDGYLGCQPENAEVSP